MPSEVPRTTRRGREGSLKALKILEQIRDIHGADAQQLAHVVTSQSSDLPAELEQAAAIRPVPGTEARRRRAKKRLQCSREAIQALATEHRPRMIVAGFSAYSQIIDWQRFRDIADEVGAFLLADIAHPAGLIARGFLNVEAFTG